MNSVKIRFILTLLVSILVILLQFFLPMFVFNGNYITAIEASRQFSHLHWSLYYGYIMVSYAFLLFMWCLVSKQHRELYEKNVTGVIAIGIFLVFSLNIILQGWLNKNGYGMVLNNLSSSNVWTLTTLVFIAILNMGGMFLGASKREITKWTRGLSLGDHSFYMAVWALCSSLFGLWPGIIGGLTAFYGLKKYKSKVTINKIIFYITLFGVSVVLSFVSTFVLGGK